MDLRTLHDIFTGSYSSDQSIRRQAEINLTQLTHQPGFISSCLDLVLNDDVPNLVKLAASISVKNVIAYNWKNTVEDIKKASNSSKSRFNDFDSNILISEEEKTIIKQKLIEIIIHITNLSIDSSVSSYEQIHDLILLKKNQLLPILSTIINIDYRNNDQVLLDSCINLIINSGEDFAKVYTGLFCLAEICRTYRWSSNNVRSETLDPLIIKVFPILVQIATSLINKPNQTSQITLDNKLAVLVDGLHGELLKFIIKCFKFVIYHDLPVPLQDKETAFVWINLQLQVIKQPLPSYLLGLAQQHQQNLESDDINADDNNGINIDLEIKNNQWVKAKKWSFANLSTLFTKYGTPMNSLTSSSNHSKEKNYLEFKMFFLDDFVPEILTLYFQLITSWCNKELYLSSNCLYHLIVFLDNCIKINKLWKTFFKSNLNEIISKFIFPVLITKNSNLKLIEEDPVEYIHITMDVFDDDCIVDDLAALNLVTTLAETRQSSSLSIILKICHDLLVELNNNASTPQAETLSMAKRKDGALRIIGSISHILVNPRNSFHSHLYDFLQYFVIPNLMNKYAFVRLRALDVIEKFSTMDLSNNEVLLFKIYQGVLVNLNIFNNETADADISHFVSLDNQPMTIDKNSVEGDEEEESLLPVQTQAALTLQAFLSYENFKEILSKDIILIMQKLLILSKKIDLDVLSGVMQEIVELFSTQLQPFGIELMKNLSSQILNIFEEEENMKAVSPDKQMVINGIMNTMVTILLSFENSSDSIFQLEESFLLVIKVILDNNLDDYYTEVFELIENSSFLSRKISKNMWLIFLESIVEKNFKNHKDDSLILTFLSESLPALNNLLTYGQEDLINEPAYANGFFDVMKIIINDGYYQEDITVNDEPGQEGSAYNMENLQAYHELAANFILSMKSRATAYTAELIETSLVSLFKQTLHTIAYYQKEEDLPQSQQNIEFISQLTGAPLQYFTSNPIFTEVFKKVLSNKKLKVNALNLIISGLIYDIHGTLDLLIKYNFFEAFFQIWFKALIPDAAMAKKNPKADLKRVFDLKISTLGLISLLNNLTSEEFQKYHLNLIFENLIQNLIYLIEKLPIAINALEKKRTAFEETSFDYNAEDQKLYESQFHAFNEDDGEEDWLNEEREFMEKNSKKSTADDGNAVSSGDIKSGEYLSFLKNESEKLESQLHSTGINQAVSNEEGFFEDEYEDEDAFEDEDDFGFDDEEAIEDPLSNNPLDNLNIFAAVKQSLNHLEQADNAKYQAFVQSLNETQVSMLQTILNQN